MAKAPLFSHRPPSSGIHLLADPLPPRPTGSLSRRAELKEISYREQAPRRAKVAKS